VKDEIFIQILVGNAGRNRPIGRPVYRLEDYIKKYFSELGWGECGWSSSGSEYGPVGRLVSTQ
jgi:hypothetical protein